MKQFIIVVDDEVAIALEFLLLPYIIVPIPPPPPPVYRGIIGKQYVPNDNSWNICLETGDEAWKIIRKEEPHSNYRKPWGLSGYTTTIISEPYNLHMKETCTDYGIKTFVNVLYKNNTFRVLWDKRWLK
jgi:hypothetical protein